MILDEILAYKRKEIEALKRNGRFASPPSAPALNKRDFTGAIRYLGAIRLIAEIKRRSPSKGELRKDLDAGAFAGIYQDAGAAAVSILTDERFFGGSMMDLSRGRSACSIPVLRKDFILDEVQIWQSAADDGADAILLVVAALKKAKLEGLLAEASRCGLAALVETHSENEVATALECGADIIGINNRNLESFEVNLETTHTLRSLIPDGKIVVAESGIHSRSDVKALEDSGVDAILVGEALVSSRDPALRIQQLLGG